MSAPKVFEFAKDVGLEPLALMNKLREWNVPVKNHMAELDEALQDMVRSRLAEEKSPKATAEGAKKKVAKKKVAAAKPAAEPVAKEKPKTVKKTTTRVAKSEADDETAAAKQAVKKVANTVIRRKAVEMAESREKEAEKEAERESLKEAAVVVAPHEAQTPPVEVVMDTKPLEDVAVDVAATLSDAAPAEAPAVAVAAAATVAAPVAPVEAKRVIPGKREVVVSSGETSGIPSRGKNIVGRMDLSRAVGPRHGTGGPRGPGGYAGGGAPRPGGFSPRPGGFAGGAPRPGGFTPRPGGPGGSSGPGRPGAPGASGIRTGFVSTQAPSFGVESRFERKVDDKRRTKTSDANTEGAAKEEEVPVFFATEFRKREMIFQPKKKKGLLNRESLKTQITTPKASKRVISIYDTIQVGDLAKAMGVKAGQLVTALMKNGMMVTMNDRLDADTAALIAPEFGFEILNDKKTAKQVAEELAFGDLTAEPIRRAPIVTVMGHVDHGKTSLLDAIRNADVAAGEAGGITQHIGAYSVHLESGHVVTFLDTPGHAAFTAMRARGANVTDIAIIVVAADDGMMPQTAEAISHAKSAGVPIIVAINKMDKQGANPERIKQQLTEFELVPEEWGGNTIYVPVSALKRTGVKELLEQVHLLAEVADLKANPKRSGTGTIVEAKMDKGRGVVATFLVKDGTIKVGQHVVAGTTYGRVRAMVNDRGEQVKEAGPSIPVEVLGLNEVPLAGDKFDVCENERTAEEVATVRKQDSLKKDVTPNSKMSLEDLFSKVQSGDVKELPIVLKSDVQGSSEAIKGMLEKEPKDKVKIKIIHSAVGGITESDVLLASTAKGLVLGFNVRPDSGALGLAKREGVEIKTYSIIYELMDDLRKAMQGLLDPDIVEKVLGHVEVRNTFNVPKIGLIAGCFVQDGKIMRSAQIRVLREGRIIYDGKIGSLKRFKDDTREVAAGFECGIGIENFNDIKVGDTLEVYEKEVIQKTL